MTIVILNFFKRKIYFMNEDESCRENCVDSLRLTSIKKKKDNISVV